MEIAIWRHVTSIPSSEIPVLKSETISPKRVVFQPGVEVFQIWGTNADTEPLITDAAVSPFFPGVRANRFVVTRFAGMAERKRDEDAVAAAGLSHDQLREDAERNLPGLFDLQSAAGGDFVIHTTPTIDYGVLLAGELQLVLEGEGETTLSPGHCVVQRGTSHGWLNRTDEPAFMAFVMIGAAT